MTKVCTRLFLLGRVLTCALITLAASQLAKADPCSTGPFIPMDQPCVTWMLANVWGAGGVTGSVVPPLQAGPLPGTKTTNLMIITEVNEKTLTVTYNGANLLGTDNVTLTGPPDDWTLTFRSQNWFFEFPPSPPSYYYVGEPEDANQCNQISVISAAFNGKGRGGANAVGWQSDISSTSCGHGNPVTILDAGTYTDSEKRKFNFNLELADIIVPISTPEPSSILFFGSGILPLAWVLRRRPS
jgi:hypothetical protein